MLPTIALISATIGLLLIIFLIFREEGSNSTSFEKSSLFAVGGFSALVAVAVIFLAFGSGGGGAH